MKKFIIFIIVSAVVFVGYKNIGSLNFNHEQPVNTVVITDKRLEDYKNREDFQRRMNNLAMQDIAKEDIAKYKEELAKVTEEYNTKISNRQGDLENLQKEEVSL